jgi:hypothetical protein
VDGNRIEARDLRLGATNGTLTQVLSGDIAPGDKLATDIKKAEKEKNGGGA